MDNRTFNSAEFKAMMDIVSTIAASNAISPHIVQIGGDLAVGSSLHLSAFAPCNWGIEKFVGVDSRQFDRLLSHTSADEFTCATDGDKISLVAGKTRIQSSVIEVSEPSTPPDLSSETMSFSLSAAVVEKLRGACVASGDGKMELLFECAMIQGNSDRLRVFTCDGYSLSVVEVKHSVASPFDIIVHNSVITTLMSVFSANLGAHTARFYVERGAHGDAMSRLWVDIVNSDEKRVMLLSCGVHPAQTWMLDLDKESKERGFDSPEYSFKLSSAELTTLSKSVNFLNSVGGGEFLSVVMKDGGAEICVDAGGEKRNVRADDFVQFAAATARENPIVINPTLFLRGLREGVEDIGVLLNGGVIMRKASDGGSFFYYMGAASRGNE